MGLFKKSSEFQVVPADSGEKSVLSIAAKARSLSLCSTAEARALISQQFCERWQILPLNIISLFDGRVLNVAVSQESDRDLAAALRFATEIEVRLIQVERDVLSQALFLSYRGDAAILSTGMQALARSASRSSEKKIKLDIREASGDVAKFLANLVDFAIAQEASDIHLAPRSGGTHLSMRVNGEMLTHEGCIASSAQHQQLINRIKVLSSLDTTVKNLPQDGSFAVSLGQRDVHVRVSTLPSIHGEKVVLRLLATSGILKIPELGLSPSAEQLLLRNLEHSEGMILFAGPTGSGKTTSMYAALQNLAERNLSISSVEDPVEIFLPSVCQTSIDEKTGLGYARAIKALLRQDPDVVLVGEIRDSESAQVAFQAALTGHLMLSTVHARTVMECFNRLKILGVDELTIAQSVSLVVCQRLLPKLCPLCKVIDLHASNLAGGERFRAVGCARCDYSGFDGQALVVEIMEMHAALSECLMRGRPDMFMYHQESEHYLSMEKEIENLRQRGLLAA